MRPVGLLIGSPSRPHDTGPPGPLSRVTAGDRRRRSAERNRRLGAASQALAEGARECPLDELDRSVVRRALGLGHDQQAVDQLDALARLEDSLVDEPLVLDTLPPSDLELWSGHDTFPLEGV